MKLYDIAFSVYHALDSLALAKLTNNHTLVEVLTDRANAVSAAIHDNLFDKEHLQYTNRLCVSHLAD